MASNPRMGAPQQQTGSQYHPQQQLMSNQSQQQGQQNFLPPQQLAQQQQQMVSAQPSLQPQTTTANMVSPTKEASAPTLMNTASLCRMGQEIVQEVIQKTLETFQLLKVMAVVSE